MVCGDSYFPLVCAVAELTATKLCFIGVVKTTTCLYSMQCLSCGIMQNYGKTHGVVTRNGNDDFTMFLAFVWMDYDRNYLFTSNNDGGRKIKSQMQKLIIIIAINRLRFALSENSL
jgi:hypothetical protein